jgi:hypothetical protein
MVVYRADIALFGLPIRRSRPVQPPPADDNAGRRHDHADERQQHGHDVPRRAIAQQQREIEAVLGVERPAICPAVIVEPADNVAIGALTGEMGAPGEYGLLNLP